MHYLLQTEFWLSLITLTLLEVILNADNIIFIVTASSRLPKQQQALARKLGLLVAAVSRIGFLSALFFATTLTTPFLHIGSWPITINNVVLILGGLFLVINPALEISAWHTFKEDKKHKHFAQFGAVIMQIMFVDIVFSIDNVVTAIGIAKMYLAMIGSIIIAMILMVVASDFLSRLVDKHPKLKIIGLCYLMWIGGVLVIRGFGIEISSGYIYLPLAFVILTQSILAYTKPGVVEEPHQEDPTFLEIQN
jgi:predicted tellurium resistance membrane protein TerC